MWKYDISVRMTLSRNEGEAKGADPSCRGGYKIGG
jgi:hypothetical protein